MAWIELHQSLRDHRKVLQAADELNITPAHMVGLLSLLWLWAIDNAEDGNLSHVTSRVMSRAAQWDGDCDAFVTALKRAGFIDEGTESLHDWLDYTGRLIEQREVKRAQNRERQQRFREKQRTNKSDKKITHTSQKNNALVSDSTVPNSTVPNSTIKNIKSATEIQAERFDQFWNTYPKKVGKEAARKSWMRLKPNEELFNKILAAVENATRSSQWKQEKGRFIPNPATWLNQGRWDDELNTDGGESIGTDRGNFDGVPKLTGFHMA